MKINNEKSQIWTLSGPTLRQILGGCSATSLLKILDAIPSLPEDTVREKSRKLIILTIFAWTTPLIVEYSNHKILPFIDRNVTTNQDINLSCSIFRKKKTFTGPGINYNSFINSSSMNNNSVSTLNFVTNNGYSEIHFWKHFIYFYTLYLYRK